MDYLLFLVERSKGITKVDQRNTLKERQLEELNDRITALERLQKTQPTDTRSKQKKTPRTVA